MTFGLLRRTAERYDRGLVAPGEFIAVAEQAGLIELLGTWILREAVRQRPSGVPRGSFGLRTAAEVIEERGQMEPLQRLGCDLAQGYLFARPASAAAEATLAGTHVSWSRGGAAPRGATRAS